MTRRELYEVWKHDAPHGSHRWCVQLPKGMMTYRTKRQATEVAEKLRSIHKLNERAGS